MELKELKQILENAPEGAEYLDEDGDYIKQNEQGAFYYINGWVSYGVSASNDLRSLSDIKTIVELMEEKDSKAITMLYGMGGYLTSMDKSITFGAKHWATPAVDIVSAIIDSNKLEGKCDFDLYVSPKVVFTKSAG